MGGNTALVVQFNFKRVAAASVVGNTALVELQFSFKRVTAARVVGNTALVVQFSF